MLPPPPPPPPPSPFTQNEDPVRVLTDYTEIVFASGLCRQARALACTTEEVVECLKDIRVLGKKDLKQLLQWREQCRQHLGLETEGDDDAVQVCVCRVLKRAPAHAFCCARAGAAVGSCGEQRR